MESRESVDLLIEARWVLPMAPSGAVLTQHAVAVQAGRIVAVGPATQLGARFQAGDHIRRPNHVVLPGLVNAHVHAATTLLRGLPVRAPLMRWLRETLWPAEERWMSPDFVRDGVQLAIAEMLRAGITTFADAYFFPEEAARAAAAARMRAVIGLPVADTPTPWAQDATEYLDKSERLWDEYRSDPWVCLQFAPQAPYSISDATLLRVRRVADELDARVAMHVHETEVEVQDSLTRHGRRPLQRLADLGLLRPGFTAVHMNRLNEQDLEIVARTGISVVACPQSNLRLGSGFCPVPELSGLGVSVGLGTDGPASGGAFDMLAEARTVALLASGLSGGARALSAHDVLRLATLDGAASLGLASDIGSIEVGKAADLMCIDLGAPGCHAADPADAVVFAATRQSVSDVWVAGRAVVTGGRLLAFDEQELLHLAQQWSERVSSGAHP